MPVLAGQLLTTASQRMEVLRKRFGDRFDEVAVRDFLRPKRTPSATLRSGGQATKASLFYNNARMRVGLVGFWDTVAFDEVAGIKVNHPDTASRTRRDSKRAMLLSWSDRGRSQPEWPRRLRS